MARTVPVLYKNDDGKIVFDTKNLPKIADAITLHSMCQPGLPAKIKKITYV
jgi:hypothetical protein